jgi:hypothetical protein
VALSGRESPENRSRIDPLNHGGSSATILPIRGNEFPLSPGERAGVRVSVKQFSPRCFQSFKALNPERKFMAGPG